MTRPQEIRDLIRRRAKASGERKRKTVALLESRLRLLMLRQLRAEIREERKSAA